MTEIESPVLGKYGFDKQVPSIFALSIYLERHDLSAKKEITDF